VRASRRALVLGVAGVVVVGCGQDEQVARKPRIARRVAYGDDPSQFGELSVPTGPPRGVAVIIHGGFWRSAYDLSLGRPLAESLVAHGWAAWNIEYRRVGNGGGDPTTFDDVAAAIDTLAELDLDLATVVAIGHSAGGHLATWAAGRDKYDRWSPRVKVTAAISQAGVLDLRQAHADHLGNGAVALFLGHEPAPGDAEVDPAQQLPLDVPVWCVHGTGDDEVPPDQSRDYVAAARAAGGDAHLVEVPGDHFVVIDEGSGAWARQLEILDQLG
jgi:acetyl esterase/lipase